MSPRFRPDRRSLLPCKNQNSPQKMHPMQINNPPLCFFALLAAVCLVVLVISCIKKGEVGWAVFYSALAAVDLWIAGASLALR